MHRQIRRTQRRRNQCRCTVTESKPAHDNDPDGRPVRLSRKPTQNVRPLMTNVNRAGNDTPSLSIIKKNSVGTLPGNISAAQPRKAGGSNVVLTETASGCSQPTM